MNYKFKCEKCGQHLEFEDAKQNQTYYYECPYCHNKSKVKCNKWKNIFYSKKEKSEMTQGCGCLILILIGLFLIVGNCDFNNDGPPQKYERENSCKNAVKIFCKLQAYNPDGLKFYNETCTFYKKENTDMEWYIYRCRLVGTNAFGGTISKFVTFRVLYSVSQKEVKGVIPEEE